LTLNQVGVSLLVAFLFFLNVWTEILFDSIMNKISEMLGKSKVIDIEEQDPASLVGGPTFKNEFLELYFN
jgi:hypothetical protein